jgi:HSP20 family protein
VTAGARHARHVDGDETNASLEAVAVARRRGREPRVASIIRSSSANNRAGSSSSTVGSTSTSRSRSGLFRRARSARDGAATLAVRTPFARTMASRTGCGNRRRGRRARVARRLLEPWPTTSPVRERRTTMANIMKRDDQGMELDPFKAMREWLRWDPFRTIAPTVGFDREWMPSFEIRENGDAFVLRADLPGIKDGDLEISLTGNRLQISGRREAEQETKDETVYLYERTFGGFSRSFTLPDGIDAEHARSALKDGVLTVTVPKLPAMKPKKIEIQTDGPRS